MKKTFIIGDVHGCYDELIELLNTINPSPQDDVYYIGDLINKGPKSIEVLEHVLASKATVILGNHELHFANNTRAKNPKSKYFHQLKEQMGEKLDFYVNWFDSLPRYIETDEFLLVHGGVVPGEHPSKSKVYNLVTIRTWDGCGKDLNNPQHQPWFHFYNDDKLVVFGHWAALGLYISENAIGLDSGCCYGNKLTALELPGRKIHQVKAKKAYQSITDRKAYQPPPNIIKK